MGEEQSESNHSCSLLESKSHNASLIDLKLGRLADCNGASGDKIAKEELTLPSILPLPAAAAKRARTCGNPTYAPVCQVYGCNLDLSSSKEYHKRHKVCDVHSKTAKVIVNGIEQRFCQQCSRFHLLAEFDDGKRSCRRRLAGHNERQRKPQFDYISNKQQKILQSYEVTNYYLGSTIQKRPQFAFQDIYGSGFYDLVKYEKVSHNGHIKLEEKTTCGPHLEEAAPITTTHGQELYSRFSVSDCALSLLSAQSYNPLDSDDNVPEIPLAINFVDKYVLSESKYFPLNSNNEAGHALQFQVGNDHNNCQPSSHLLNDTVDLLELSSHLQRVEHQRNSVQVIKQGK